MSRTLDQYHPRHYKSPVKFSIKDKALLLKSHTRIFLLIDTSVKIHTDKPLQQEAVTHSLGLNTILSRLSPAISSPDLLTYFQGGKHTDIRKSTAELVTAFGNKKLALYQWPYGMDRPRQRAPGRYDPKAAPPEMPKSPLAGVKKSGGYQAPIVPTLAELEEIGRKMENVRNLDSTALSQQAMAMARQQIPKAAPAIDQINDIAAGVAKGVDTKALAGDAVMNMAGSTLSGLPALPIDQTKCEGEPISLVTGEELLKLTDLTLNGPLPLSWWRVYRSSNPNDCGLGHGWSHSLNEWLTIQDNQLQLHDAEGRLIPLPLPAIGEKAHNTAEQLSVLRESDTGFVITPYSSPYGVRRYFKLIDSDDARYRLIAIKNSHQAGYTCQYDNNQLQKVLNSHGDSLHFSYTACGHIADVMRKDKSGHTTIAVTYRYSTEGDLIQVSDADGYGERYTYENHIIRKRQLKSGYCFYFEWDQLTPQARCIRQHGQVIKGEATYDYRFEWDNNHGQVIVTDTRGAQHTYRHNDQGKLTYHKDAEGNETHYHFNENGQPIATEYPDGSIETIEYNHVGQPVCVNNVLGQIQETEYDKQGRVSAVIHYTEDNKAVRWSYVYNDHNQLIRVTNPAGQHTDYTYNILGLIGTVSHAGLQQARYWWNEQGLLTQEKDAMGRLTQYRYNQQQQVTEVRHPNGHSTRYRYNTRGQVNEITSPDNQKTQYSYTELGYLQIVKDPNGTTTEYAYDGLSQVTRRTITDQQGQQSTLNYVYDGERNLTGLENEKGERYQLAYDNNERLIQEIGFDGRTTEYKYNALGHVVKQIEYGSDHSTPPIITEYQRNTAGQIIKKTNSDGSTQFAYDHQGRLTAAVNEYRQLFWVYNDLGQLVAECQDDDVIKYQYNAAGQCTHSQLPNKQLLEWQYNAANQFSGLRWFHRDPSEKTGIKQEQLLTVQYHNSGQERFRDHGNGLRTLSVQNPQGRLASKGVVKHTGQEKRPEQQLIETILGGLKKDYTGLQTTDYRYSPTGQLTEVNDSVKGKTLYHYDVFDRLTEVEGKTAEHFVHDPAHNLLAIGKTKAEAEERAQHSEVNHNRLQQQGNTAFDFDGHGNRIKTGGPNDETLYKYNAEHRLSAVKNAQGITRYTYDALGRRVQKQHRDNHGAITTTQYLWQGDNLLQETKETENNTDKQTYLYEPNSHRPIVLIKDNHAYRYHLDHLGTPEALTDDQGHVVWMVNYASYGKVANNYHEYAQLQYQRDTNNPQATLPDIEQPLRFQGQYHDTETGLHYSRHRYYDPDTGSFITQDPIKLQGGINNYQYVPNPIQWIDPLGLQNKEDHEGQSWLGTYTDTLNDMGKQVAKEQAALHEKTSGWGNVMQGIYKPVEGLGRAVGNTVGLLEVMSPNGVRPSIKKYWADQWQGVKDVAGLAVDAATGDPAAAAKLTPAVVAGAVMRKMPGGKKNNNDNSGGTPPPSKKEIELAKSEGNSPKHIAARQKVARNYLENNGFDESQINDALGSPNGLTSGGVDLTKPVEIVNFPPPDTMTQYVKSHGYPGNWFDPLSKQTPDQLGINGETRTLKSFKVPKGSGLQSYSKPILDDWTVPENPVQTKGGGVQLFVNDDIKKGSIGI